MAKKQGMAVRDPSQTDIALPGCFSCWQIACLAVFYKAMNCHDYITVDPAVLVGKPVVRGTRLAVEFVLGLIAQGWAEEEIMRNYRLTHDQVRACAAYAQERVSEEKAFASAK